MRILALTLSFTFLATGCHSTPAAMTGDDAPSPDAGAPSDAGPTGCPAGMAGSACVLALYDAAVADCTQLAALKVELAAHPEPLWANGRALVQTGLAVAGDWNNWSTTAMVGAPICGGAAVAVGAVPTGRHQYKLTDGTNWSLDKSEPGFAFDDFAGNADGRNSVLNTPDSGLGHIVSWGDECSDTLGDCREVTAYLPPGYGADEKPYPVLFMHDGQNLWDDHDCCFGHTGWELNVTLDAEIAAHKVAPIVVIGAASTVARNNQYGLDAATTAMFVDFQIHQLQPHALVHVRWDGSPLRLGGSSLGGLMAMEIALANPSVYAGAASLSGAFWPGLDDGTALLDKLPSLGKQQLAIYLDSGGNVADDSDGAQDTVDVMNKLMTEGWTKQVSPTCAPGPNAICYHQEPGATHDELAWKARAWRFLEFLFPAS